MAGVLLSSLTFLPASSQMEMSSCDCWNEACGYCADLSCAVKYDLANSDEGVTVTTQLKRKELNSMLFFNGAGNALGMFRFSLSQIHLTGCIACNAPEAVREARRAFPDGNVPWTIRFNMGGVKLAIGGEVVFEQELIGECAEHYTDIQYFAFYEAESCQNKFTLAEVMVAGENINETCGGTCPEM